MDDRRNFQRVPFATEAEIHHNNNTYRGNLLDISLQGALVQGKVDIPVAAGNRCRLTIPLMDSDITLQFEAEIIHCRDKRVGFKFKGEDTETVTHLRRLLELNIGSSEVLDREIELWLNENS